MIPESHISSGGQLVLATNHVTINADYVIIESGGVVDSSGAGYAAGSGPGSGSGRAGGSHASPGGAAASGNQYGSVYWPDKPGSGGGYGAGGGWVYIQTGSHVIVEGAIRANGVGASSSSSGGGSGGAIIIKSLFLKGYGTIECHGGLYKQNDGIGHLRVVFCLCFKTNPGATLFIWKLV